VVQERKYGRENDIKKIQLGVRTLGGGVLSHYIQKKRRRVLVVMSMVDEKRVSVIGASRTHTQTEGEESGK